MKKNSLLIIVYFGNFTVSAKKSLASLLENNIDVMLFSDSHVTNNYKNFYYNHLDSTLLSQIVENKLQIKQNFDSAYKLCDYKILFPFIFTDYYKKDYAYIGFCDVDVLYGDINSFIDLPIKKNVDVIGNRGHFTLINSSYYDKLYSKLISKDTFPIFKHILESKHNYAFDEFQFLHKLLKLDKNISWNIDISKQAVDLNYYHKDYFCSNRNTEIMSIEKNNQIINVILKNKTSEKVSYIHFQKREIPFQVFKVNSKFIVNNNFSFSDKFLYFMKIFKKRVKAKLTSEPIIRKKYYANKFLESIIEK